MPTKKAPIKKHYHENMSEDELRIQLDIRKKAAQADLENPDKKLWHDQEKQFVRQVERVKDLKTPAKRKQRYAELMLTYDNQSAHKFDIRQHIVDQLNADMMAIQRDFHLVYSQEMTGNSDEGTLYTNKVIFPDVTGYKKCPSFSAREKAALRLKMLGDAREAFSKHMRANGTYSPIMLTTMYQDLAELRKELKKHQPGFFSSFKKDHSHLNKLVGEMHKMCPKDPEVTLAERILPKYGRK